MATAYQVEERTSGGWTAAGVYSFREEADRAAAECSLPTRVTAVPVPDGYSPYQGRLYQNAELERLARKYAE